MAQSDNADNADEDVIGPKVTVLSSFNGAVLKGGTQVLIEWDSVDDRALGSHRVQASMDGGRTYRDISDQLPADAKSFLWTVPSVRVERGRIKVVARDAAGNLGFGTSAGTFSVAEPDRSAPVVDQLEPSAGPLTSGAELALSWRTTDNGALRRHAVYLSVDGGRSYNTLAQDLPGAARRAVVKLPAVITTLAVLRVVAEDDQGNQGVCSSAAPLLMKPR